MEAMRMKFFVILMVALMAVAVEKVAAADGPAPTPTSDAALYVPTFVASLIALAFGFLF
ncbi:Arabinogalactan peptide [Melia azedarach]|uniref:Arabinogalactan peptide n=1 Tax=Melia azedarach TaxID=155640 RepID=A0ACC1YK19_MELAZ|nr:Arabinogalactan peptide [Melia azedarach]